MKAETDEIVKKLQENSTAVQHGSVEVATLIDSEGSTKKAALNFQNGVLMKPVRWRYKIRHRTDKTDLARVQEIAAGLLGDFTKLDTALELEKTKAGELQGFYHLVECYTTLEY